MFIIISEKCSSCGLCADVCPTAAITPIGIYRINPDICTSCGLCQESCPSLAISFLDSAARQNI